MLDGQSLGFMEELTNSFGPSGFEEESSRIVKRYVSSFSDRVYSDKLGSVIFESKGTVKSPVVLLAGHVDEVGFIVSSINKQGFLTFNPLGDWWDQVLLSQRVLIRTDGGFVHGVIASKPPHLLSADERTKIVARNRMFIDIGASNADEVKAMGVRIGNPIVPDSPSSKMTKRVFRDGRRKGEDIIMMGKAVDNRVGAWAAAEVVRTFAEKRISHPNTIVGAATTLEEEGLRGARTTAYLTKPDVCIAIDTDVSGDVPGIDESEAASKMGYGPSLTTFDSSMIPNQKFVKLMLGTGEKVKIPIQLSQVVADTDAGVIHTANAGCPSVTIGVPARHLHSHVGVFSLTDAENLVKLIVEVVRQLDARTVAGFTEI